MAKTTVEYTVKCKRCQKPIGYSGMMYEKMQEFGQSRPEYCDACRADLLMEKMTMGAAYFTMETVPGVDVSEAVPGELGKVKHPDRPHTRVEKIQAFDQTSFGATPQKIVEIYEWFKTPGHQVAIVIGGTGSGKSTALPYWLIYPPEGVPSDFFLRDGQILITQPRIVATTGISKYLGTLVGSSVGKGFDIGYRYSKDRNADRFNAAFMATDGSLINMINKGQLADLSVVMIDEAHERSLNIDIILRLLKDQLPLYPHLKVLIVSATINRDSFLEYFGSETATVVEFEPKSIHKYVRYFAESKEALPYDDPARLRSRLVPALSKKITWLLNEIVEGRRERGHILSFLHGVKPIEEAVAMVKRAVDSDPKLRDVVEVFPLYSDLDEIHTDFALYGEDKKKIRVIVSTNVAEASLTVEDVVYVIESGVENQAQWDTGKREKSVVLELISQANAKQRWGRAGRSRDGEVFCLYTENQFNQMLPFPIPAIQRTSMEDIILVLKKLGIDDFEDGWVDRPAEEESKRSIASLRNSGAVDADNMLTEYGLLLSQFQYPAALTDFIIMADRFGCVVEAAWLLPIIKNGGFKNLLLWDNAWEQDMKERVEKIHRALWKDCRDDVEFVFRLLRFWKNPPEIIGNKDGKKRNLAERRIEWCKAFFVNLSTIEEDIAPETEKVLRLLNAHKKDRNFRDIDLALLSRLRMVLAYSLKCSLASADTKYSYIKRLPIEEAAASCLLDLPKEIAERLELEKQRKTSVISLACLMVAYENVTESVDELTKRVFQEPELPIIDTEALDTFISKYKLGDSVTVEVMGFSEHAGDNRVSLQVREVETGYVGWLLASDLCFTQSSTVVKLFLPKTKLLVRILVIDRVKSLVRLSRLNLVEEEVRQLLVSQKRVDGIYLMNAKVIEIRKDGKAVLLSELSVVERGLLLPIMATEKALGKSVGELKLGESLFVGVAAENDWDYKANLDIVTKTLERYLKGAKPLLSWSEGKLSFQGKMTWNQFMTLMVVDNDPSFQKALEYLYLSSNMIWLRKVVDVTKAKTIKDLYPAGKMIRGVISRVIDYGLVVTLADGTKGFIGLAEINSSRRFSSARGLVSEGEELMMKVIGFDEARQQVSLSLLIAENEPLKIFRVGDSCEGIVDNLTNFGAFVRLRLGYSGMIHVSKMGRRVNSPSDILKKGDRVAVEIIGVIMKVGKLEISLRLKSVVG